MKMFKYEWIWDKVAATGMFFAKSQPMRKHENIVIFCKKRTPFYPQKKKRNINSHSHGTQFNKPRKMSSQHMPNLTKHIRQNYDINQSNPDSIITFSRGNGHIELFHPTQKPVKLLEYLIRTYTNENETVLDFTCGSGSTGCACIETNRNFIGIELDENYFKIATDRIDKAKQSPKLFY